ncbi:methyltransferase, partial [Mesorhizobium sp. CC13]|uniref:methyltransferase n=1 Tax=Mesorhizobium sp. CC13 TaxID=3029194 RepID=UPI00326512D1
QLHTNRMRKLHPQCRIRFKLNETDSRPEGTLVVLEAVLAPPNEGARAKFADLNMLAVPGGQERTEEEFARLFGAAGFRLTRTIDAGPRISIIEGKPA